MKTMLVVLMLCVFAASASAATMVPMSDSSLSAVAAGNGQGGGGGGDDHHGDSDTSLLIETFVIDQGQQNVTALNLVNAGGPVQVGSNILVVTSPEMARIDGSTVIQAVVNLQHQECAPCAFDDATLQTGVSGRGQQNACAVNLVNAAGAVNAGSNILAVVSCDGPAGISDSCVAQVVVNGACQTTPFSF